MLNVRLAIELATNISAILTFKKLDSNNKERLNLSEAVGSIVVIVL